MIKTLTEMITVNGKITTSNIISLYGQSQVGKTTLALQILWELSHIAGKPALVYDTEGGIYDTIEAWAPVFRSKWPKGKIHTRTIRDIRKILHDHGVKIKFLVSEKIELRRQAILDKIPLDISKYCMICYDSYTAPFKIFGLEMQNFPARSDASWIWNIGIFNIQDQYKIPIIQIHHAVKPIIAKSPIDKMAGGQSAQYPSKYIFNLIRPAMNKQIRYIYTLRHPRYAPFERNWRIDLKDDGYADAGNTTPLAIE